MAIVNSFISIVIAAVVCSVWLKKAKIIEKRKEFWYNDWFVSKDH